MSRRTAAAPVWPLRSLAILSVALPVLVYSSLAAFRYNESMQSADQRLSRSLRVANEHASKVMAGAEGLQGRMLDLVEGRRMQDLRSSEKVLHEALAALVKGQGQIESAWIIGADGRPIASSLVYPVPPNDYSDREYFRFHQGATAGRRYLSEPFTTKVARQRVLDISVRFDDAQGQFGGVVNVSLLTSYFDRVYADLVADEPGLAVSLYRSDGAIYTRWPAIPDLPPRVSPDSPVMQRIVAGQVSGEMRARSSFDGRERLLGFSKVDQWPLFVGTSMGLSEVRSEVFGELAILLAIGLPPFAALFFATLLAIRRTREALDTAQRLQAETLTRRRAEEALLQAQKLEAMGRLTGGVAHDFNNALMVISNNAFLLQRNVAEAGQRQLQSIARAVDSATKLTRQLLAFSRRHALVPELVRLQDRLPATRELLAPVLGSSIRLAIEVEPDTAPIHVDPAELELALLNLSINARDAMGLSGSFTVKARNCTANLPAQLAAGAVVVEATDDGPGIAPDVLDKVFEPFFTTKPVGHGTGLGLSQVYGFCARAGGTATIASTPGQGATVRLFFPPAPPGSGPRELVRLPVDRQLGRDLLVVEDNREVADALVPLLEAMGCHATRVDSAEAALEWLAGRPQLPDLVLSDVKMPGSLDGLGLAQRLRTTRPTLPVLLMTGYADSIDAITELGFEVLPKPCAPEVLGAAIARLTTRPAPQADTQPS